MGKIILWLLILYIIPEVLTQTAFPEEKWLSTLFEAIFPFMSCSKSLAEILSNKDTDYPASVYYRFAFFAGQTVVFLGLAIFIDY